MTLCCYSTLNTISIKPIKLVTVTDGYTYVSVPLNCWPCIWPEFVCIYESQILRDIPLREKCTEDQSMLVYVSITPLLRRKLARHSYMPHLELSWKKKALLFCDVSEAHLLLRVTLRDRDNAIPTFYCCVSRPS